MCLSAFNRSVWFIVAIKPADDDRLMPFSVQIWPHIYPHTRAIGPVSLDSPPPRGYHHYAAHIKCNLSILFNSHWIVRRWSSSETRTLPLLLYQQGRIGANWAANSNANKAKDDLQPRFAPHRPIYGILELSPLGRIHSVASCPSRCQSAASMPESELVLQFMCRTHKHTDSVKEKIGWPESMTSPHPLPTLRHVIIWSWENLNKVSRNYTPQSIGKRYWRQ